MKIINQQFLEALRKLKLKVGTNKNIAKAAFISEAHVGRLIAGRIEMLKDDTYDRLLPLVEPYFDKNHDRNGHFPITKTSDEKITSLCPAGLSDMEKLLVKYFRRLHEEEKLSFLVTLKDKCKV